MKTVSGIRSSLTVQKTVGSSEPFKTACDFLADASGLSKSRIKDAMIKGAVWLTRSGKRLRMRRASTQLSDGDRLELYYNEELLNQLPSKPRLLDDLYHYSVWFKPSGLLSQGTNHGDFCTLERQADFHFKGRRPIYIVHRLDREANGLMLLAHSRKAAGELSRLFRERRVNKRYIATVRGRPADAVETCFIDAPLDGREALTEYTLKRYDQDNDTSELTVSIKTGRLHQIRRHLASIGHPIVGDRKYGNGSKAESLALTATEIEFDCPLEEKHRRFSLEQSTQK
ncbi:MAG: RluA family pseudouridine synthase [Deltaproteobacteria bacterium]|nr:RluA family pseudouridine synthase [Deltaproteobacteria bacterium]